MTTAPTRSKPPAPREAAGREFVFTPADFTRVRTLIYEHAGISLSEAKQDMVYSRLARRVRETGQKSFDDYLARLSSGDKLEWEKFVNALTTNLTSFFREEHHFPILAEYLKTLQKSKRSPIKIWCSAASTGEEAYSIAMTAVEALNGFDVPVSVIASDLDTNVLATAEKGVYTQDRVDKISPARLAQFFTKDSAQLGAYRVRPELRRLVRFFRLNLLESHWAVNGPLDVLFCRNVMIYFDKPTQRKILARFAPLMSPDGRLFAGHSESFLHSADFFRSRGKTVYELATPPNAR